MSDGRIGADKFSTFAAQYNAFKSPRVAPEKKDLNSTGPMDEIARFRAEQAARREALADKKGQSRS